jgi:hypothetical protein
MIPNLKSTTNCTAEFYLHLLKYRIKKLYYDKIISEIKRKPFGITINLKQIVK